MTPAQRLAALEHVHENTMRMLHRVMASVYWGNDMNSVAQEAGDKLRAVLASLRADVEAPSPAQVTPTLSQLQTIEWCHRVPGIGDTCPVCGGDGVHQHMFKRCWLGDSIAALSAAPPAPTAEQIQTAKFGETVRVVGPFEIKPDMRALAAPAPTLPKRYDLVQLGGWDNYSRMLERSDGDWVRFDDVAPAAPAPTPPDYRAALKRAHEVLQHADAVIDPEEHPDVSAAIDALLLPCDESMSCPTVAALPPVEADTMPTIQVCERCGEFTRAPRKTT